MSGLGFERVSATRDAGVTENGLAIKGALSSAGIGLIDLNKLVRSKLAILIYFFFLKRIFFFLFFYIYIYV
jgi:hypothetical protein